MFERDHPTILVRTNHTMSEQEVSFQSQSHTMTSILKNLTILDSSSPFFIRCDTTISASINLTLMDVGICIFTNRDLSRSIGVDLTFLNSDVCRIAHKNAVPAPLINPTAPQRWVGSAATNANTSTCLTSQETILQQGTPLANIDRIKIVRALSNIAPKGQAT